MRVFIIMCNRVFVKFNTLTMLYVFAFNANLCNYKYIHALMHI